MLRKLITVLTVLAAACVANAQSSTTITASSIADSFTHPIAAAKLCFAPVDATGTATGFRVGSVQVVTTPVCGVVSNGVLQSGLSVVPNPTGTYYHITTQNRTTGAILRDYGMAAITGSSWTLDGYDPASMAVLPTAITMGTTTTLSPGSSASCSVSGSGPAYLNCGIPKGDTGATGPTGATGLIGSTGPAGPTGVMNSRGAWAATTAYAVNDAFNQGGSAYVVTIAYTSGGSFGSTDTTHAQVVGGYTGVNGDGSSGLNVTANVKAKTVNSSVNGVIYVKAPPYNAACDLQITGWGISISTSGVISGGFPFGSTDVGKILNAYAFGAAPYMGTIASVTGGIATVTPTPISTYTPVQWEYGTDDHTAITAAFTAATALGEPVQFPVGACLTSTITHTGQTFFGEGPLISRIQGMPGQDTIAGPNTSGVNYLQRANVHDISLVVDSSINKSATAGGGDNTFPDRISGTNGGGGSFGAISPMTNPVAGGPAIFGPGGVCSGSMTAGSHTFTCSGMQFTSIAASELVGQPITASLVGPSGGTLVTTIASVIDGSNISLTAAASTTSSVSAGSLGTGLVSPFYFGNCAAAYPESNGAWAYNLNTWEWKDVSFGQFNPTAPRSGHSCAMFMQAMPYAWTFEQVGVTGMYGGLIEALPNNDIGGSGFPWSPDTNSYKDLNLAFNTIPMITYNGGGRHFSSVAIYAGEQLFTLCLEELAPNGQGGNLNHNIDGYFCEGFGGNSGENSRFMGQINMGPGGGINEGAGGYTAWYANNSTVDSPATGLIKVFGSNNKFTNIIGSSNPTDLGNGNSAIRPSNTTRAYTSPTKDIINRFDGSFLLGNSGTPYANASDLLIACNELVLAFNPSPGDGTIPGCVNDPTGTEITKSYLHVTSTQFPTGYGTGFSSVNGFYGKSLIIGDRIPQTKMTLVIQGKCNAACTHPFQIFGTSSGTLLNSSVTFGTNWTIQRLPVDFTSTTLGEALNFNVPASGTWSGYTDEYTAFYAFEPTNTDLLASLGTLPSLSANNAWTGNETHSGTEIFNTSQTTFNAAVVHNAAVSFTGSVTMTGGTAGFVTNSTSNGSGFWNMQAAGVNIWQVGTFLSGIGGNTWGLHDYVNNLNPFTINQNSPSGSITIASSGVTIPTLTSTTMTTGHLTVNAAAASFSKGMGTTFMQTGTASPADLSGRIALTAATSASYTFVSGPVSGGYNQVNCIWQPRFNIGTTTWWDTSTGTTASVATSAAVTGAFGYFCVVQF